MSRFQVLPPYEAKQFDEPPKFNRTEREEYFTVDQMLEHIMTRGINDESKVGAIIQLGYFRASGKFYATESFRKNDICYVCSLLKIPYKSINLSKNYPSTSKSNHKRLILDASGFEAFNKHKELFDETIKQMIENHMMPRKIIFSVIDLFNQKKIETPSYDAFARSITKLYHAFENDLTAQLAKVISDEHKQALNSLLEKDSKGKALISRLKHINHSVKPGQIKNSIARFDELDAIYQRVYGLLSSIKISSEAISYYGKLTIKYQLAQINNLVDGNQRHLYLLAFVVHQYKCWQDVFLQIVKKSVRATDNKASKSIDATYAHNAPTKNELTDSVADGYYDYRNLVTQIEKKAFDRSLNNDQFRCNVQDILNNKNSDHLNQSDHALQTLQGIMDKEKSHQGYFDQHDQLSRKLQNKVAEIIKRLHFTFEAVADDLKSAIEYYQSGASITKTLAQDAFLSDQQYAQIYQDGQFNISLYKSMLYVNLFDAINCGAASLAISYKYLPINAYMMDENSWKKNKKLILERLGLESFENIDEVLVKLQSILDQQYYDANAKIHSDENPFIRFNAKKNDSLIIKTPAVDKPNYESVAHMIGEERNIPILEMLTSLNKFLRFTTPLTHFKVKSKVKIPDDELFIAGIFALGSDIGIQRLSKSSIGINANKLNNAVKWYFAVENLHAVNNLLTDFMNKMSLPEQFKKEKDFLHTSSDGRKRSVSIESLVSNYSYKYFGHGKGINIYIFVDERGILFHSTVFSSSDRDAPYVIDGLLHNEGIKSDMHSTDTHGYTEAIFAISHLLGITFAPRIAKLSKQRLSSFGSIKEGLVEKGYKVLPSHKIDVKLIKDHWDMILRLIASIKSRDFRASTILKRLSSYDKKHALQEAIQEFGKIIKSIFILNYIDSVELRQSIEKQLNKGELSNKFSKAVSFAPNQEINEAEREDQEKTAICKMIIQNAIILWNYIELTMMILNEKDEDKRKEMLANIKESSILTWRHVNMHGIYDFSKLIASNEPEMTAQEILDAEVA